MVDHDPQIFKNKLNNDEASAPLYFVQSCTWSIGA